jgi:hypothetical protein
MRLLHAKTKSLEEFFGKDIPPYAILSHTWDPNEVTFKDIDRNGYKSGSTKINGCCRQAVKDGLEYVWIDTCCIDKSSSAELSEAINSMWLWYQEAKACYAYLSDVPNGNGLEKADSAFRRSRWFTRGWTLQELVAPPTVCFYDKSWGFLGRKSGSTEDKSFTTIVSDITWIPSGFLENVRSLRAASVAQKMSWAAGRTTTRTEDVAYSLLGIFGVNIPMLYGEGRQAFIRLQQEIIKSSDDESIFAWGFRQNQGEKYSLFAFSPADFANCGNLLPFVPAGVKSSHYSLTNKGLHIEMSICDLSIGGGTSVGRLNCSSFDERGSKSISLPLIRSTEGESTFSRVRGCPPILIPSSLFAQSTRTQVYLHQCLADWVDIWVCGLKVKTRVLGEEPRITFGEFYPPAWRPVLSHGMMWNRRAHLETQQQSILCLCESDLEQNFVVRIDYRFQLSRCSLRPQELQCRAAFIEGDKTLAELMFKNGENIEMETALDWQESLDFGKVELISSLDKEAEDEYWILDIVVMEKEGQSDDEEAELVGEEEELEELAMGEQQEGGRGEDDIDNLEDEDYHHDTSGEDPRPKKRRKGRLKRPHSLTPPLATQVNSVRNTLRNLNS